MPMQTLVLRGGGIKGLAFAGALQVLERYGLQFDLYGGTSAGGIAALFLGAGMNGLELEAVLSRTDFHQLVRRRNTVVSLCCLLRGHGWYDSQGIGQWVASTIRDKLGLRSLDFPLERLPLHAVAFGADRARGAVEFDSRRKRRDAEISTVARATSAIPLVFRPITVDERRVFDGGLLHNFPLELIEQMYPKARCVGLYVTSDNARRARMRQKWLPLEVLDIVLGQDELRRIELDSSRIVDIDVGPIDTTEFSLSEPEKQYLLAAGRAGAMKYIAQAGLPTPPAAVDFARALEEAAVAKELVLEQHQAKQLQ
jgi:predicted acylesterase/phospholipase RssA